MRLQKSHPIPTELKARLDWTARRRSSCPEARWPIQYTLNQWTALCRYTEQSFLNIDNNAAERALKRVAIRRKKWLFAGNDAAGQSHARRWTLIERRATRAVPAGVPAQRVARIGSSPLSKLDQFLPEVWKAEEAAEPGMPELTH